MKIINTPKTSMYLGKIGIALLCLTLFFSNLQLQAQLAGWEMNGLSSYGPSPFTATSHGLNVTVGALTRGSGMTTTGTASANAWGGNGLNATTLATAIAANDFATFTVKANSGYALSLGSISRYSILRSATGPTNGQWQYSLDGTSFINIGAAFNLGLNIEGVATLQAAVSLAFISDLQNVPASATITLRFVVWGASDAAGTWYLYDYTSGIDFELIGLTTVAAPCVPPITLPTGFSVTLATSSSLNVNWLNIGSGNNVLVVARAGSAVNANPVLGQTYSANASFGLGAQIGTGNFVVYNGSGLNINVTGLQAGVQYFFAIYTYNTIGSCYNTLPLTGSGFTSCTAVTNVSGLNLNCGDITAAPSWTHATCYDEYMVVVKLNSSITAVPTGDGSGYYANLILGLGSVFDGGFVVYKGSQDSINGIITNLLINQNYYIKVFTRLGTDWSSGVELSCASCVAPITLPTGFSVTQTTGTSMNVNWLNLGSGNNVIVVARAGSAVNASPLIGQLYNANASFGLGAQIGTGNFVVYNGSGLNINVTGLQAGIQYFFAIYTYNSVDACYNLIPLTGSGITTCDPVTNVSALNLNCGDITATPSWTHATCYDEYMVVVKLNSSITAVPTGNGSGYIANLTLGLGTAFDGGFVVYKGSLNSINGIITGLLNNQTYYVKVFSRLGTSWSSGVELSCVSCIAPITLPTGFSVTLATSSSMNVNWLSLGSGNNVIVVARAGSAVNANPISGQTYNANAAFGLGTQIGSGNFVVYNGTGLNVNVTGLQGGIQYYYAIYTYNSAGSCYNLIPLTGSGNTSCATVTNVTGLNLNCGYITAAPSWTHATCYDEYMVVVKLNSSITAVPTGDGSAYIASLTLGLGTAFDGGFVVYKGSMNSINGIITGLLNNQDYYIKVFTRLGTVWSSGIELTCASCIAPITQPTGFSVTLTTSTSMNVNWLNIGSGDNVIVVARAGSAVNANPVGGQTYNADASYGLGAEIGTGNFVVYNGAGLDVNVTGLQGGVEYFFAIYAYNSISACYNLVPLTGSGNTTCTTVTNVTDVILNCGDETAAPSWTHAPCYDEYMIVVKLNSAVSTLPTGDGSGYTASLMYGLGSMIDGGFVVYIGSQDSINGIITNLRNDQIYYFTVFTRVGNVWSSGIVSNCTSCNAPVTLPTGFSVTLVSSTSMNVNWSDIGSGDNVIVIARAGSAVNASPVSGESYNADATFGLGAEMGTGNFVVYNGAGLGVNVTGLQDGIEYHFAIYSYNYAGTCYNLTPLTGSGGTTCIIVTDASNLSLNCGNTTAAPSWTHASCYDEYMVVVKLSSSITAVPTGDGSGYNANLIYGLGDSFDGGYVVYIGSLDSINGIITGLTNDQIYFFKVFTRFGTVWSSGVELSCAASTNPNCLFEEFNAPNVPAGWLSTSVDYTVSPGGASFNEQYGELATYAISNPFELRFDLFRNDDLIDKTFFVEISTTSQESGFSIIATYNHSNTNVGITPIVIDLLAYNSFTNVYIRFRKVCTTTNPWILDDVEVICLAALPVTLLSFKTVGNNNNQDLTWTYETPERFDYFEIEHSRDSRNFNALGRVAKGVTTTGDYNANYTHIRPGAGVHYYRLRMVDLNGSFTNSQVVQGRIDGSGSVRPLSTFISTEGFNVTVETSVNLVEMRLVDQLGRTVYQSDQSMEAGVFNVPVTHLSSGLYFLQVNVDGVMETFKLVR